MVVKDIYIVDDYCFFCGMVCSLADSQFYAIYGYFDINDFFSNYMNLNIYILNSLTTTAPPSLERLVVYPYNSSYKLVAYGHEGSSYSKVVEIDDAMNPAPTCSVADMGSFFWNGARLMIQDIILTNDYVVFLTDDANMRIGYSYGNKNAVVNDLVSLPNKFYYLPDEVNGIMVGVALENDDIGMAYVHYNSYFSTRLRVIDVTTGTDLYSYEFYKYDKEDPIKMVYLNKLGKIELLQPITTLSDFVSMNPYIGASYPAETYTHNKDEYNNMYNVEGDCFISTSGDKYYLQNRTVTPPLCNPNCPESDIINIELISNVNIDSLVTNYDFKLMVTGLPLYNANVQIKPMIDECYSAETNVRKNK